MLDWQRLRQNYQPGAKLYACRRLKFGDRFLEHGEELPPVSEKDHRELWRAGHADHLPQSPYVAAVEKPAKRASR